MIGAALLAKKAVERGLSRKPWVKTTLAPGSKVVVDYYERSGLTPYLDKLGFNLVGYGCTTCIGNSGPLQPEISAGVSEGDLAVVSVLSGNRNFEGRINPDVKMNYLASPPLVVAYALAGTMDLDITTEPLGIGSDGEPVYLADLWPSEKEIADVIGDAIQSDMFSRDYADVFAGDERWQGLPLGDSGPEAFSWDDGVDLRPQAPVLRGHAARAGARRRHRGRPRARHARRQRHHRPHQPGRLDQEGFAGRQVPRPTTASTPRTSTPTARAAATTR